MIIPHQKTEDVKPRILHAKWNYPHAQNAIWAKATARFLHKHSPKAWVKALVEELSQLIEK